MIKTLQISEKKAWDLAFNALVNNNTSEDNAKEVADALISAEFDGQAGHGLSRIPSYVEQLTAGKVKGNEAPTLLSSSGSVIRVDAKNGFAYPAISLALKGVKDIDLKAAFPPEISYEINIDDIHITPDAFGKNHQQDRLPIIDWLTLADRQCCVIVDDKITDILPIVHHTVIQRINGDDNYRPKSLKTVNYKILYSDQKVL